MNLVYGQLEQRGEEISLRIGSQSITLTSQPEERSGRLRSHAGQRVVVGIRPHHLKDPIVTPVPDAAVIQGVVRMRESLGTETVLHIAVDAERFGGKTSTESEEVTLASETRLLACVDPASRVQEGETVRLAMEPRRIHVFDAETEESLL
jgi:multiple sugar transport system ATP-binding protein